MANDAKNYAYLVFVDGQRNHNKFYEITENKDGSIDVSYGRVDGKAMHHHYSAWEKDFHTLKFEKEAKGYSDVTALHMEKEVSSDRSKELSYAPVEDEVVQKALERMIEASRMFMARNYTVSAKDVTPKMIEEAEADLKRLSQIAENSKNQPVSLYRFNEVLTELFTDVPRAMKKVNDYMAQTSDDFDKIIARENQMLQNLKSAVQMAAPVPVKDGDKTQTVLEARGLTMRQTTFKEEDRIIDHLGKDYQGDVERRFIRAFAVENLQTRANYEQFKKEHHIDSRRGVKLFYHGSKVENWYSIMSSGLSLNPNARVTGKMFGQGLYFAPECRKALNYMDVKGSRWNDGQEETGYTAIFSVALGKVYEPSRVLGSSFTAKDLPRGCDSVFASKHNPNLHLQNDEYIVYSQDACTIKYMMEMSHHHVRDLDFSIDRKALRDSFMEHTDDMTVLSGGELSVPIQVGEMSDSARTELLSHFSDKGISELTVVIDPKADHIQNFTAPLAVDAAKGTHDFSRAVLKHDFTKDDLKFLLREVKKNFAEGNYEWSCLTKLAESLQKGDVIKALHPSAPSPAPPDEEKEQKTEKEIA